MKKIFIAIFIMTLSVYVSAGEVTAELGMIPRTASLDWNKDAVTREINLDNVFFLDLGVRFDLPLHFYVGGDVKTFMVTTKFDKTSMFPFYTDYQFDLGWTYKWFTIGYSHVCAHSIDTIGWSVKAPILTKDSSYDVISVKVKKQF